MVKILHVLLFILTLLTVVYSLRTKVLYIKAGEMVAMHCPWYNNPDAELLWTSNTSQELNLTSNESASADQSQMGVLIHGWSLVIPRVSLIHQGNYTCSIRNTSSQFWFRLRVYTTKSREYDERSQYPMTCYTQESCTLFCPTESTPNKDSPNITMRDITWYKEGETSPTRRHFSSVEEKDSGVYTCIRSYFYRDQIYNRSFMVVLDVLPNKQYKGSVILSPRQNDVFPVNLGSIVVIECKAIMYSEYEEVFWLSETSFVEINNSLPVFYNYSRTKSTDEIIMTASLVFKQVSEEDMLKNYTCKLESDLQPSTFVTITLTQKASPVSLFPSLHLVLCIMSIIMTLIVSIIIIQKFKIRIARLLRDTFGCKGSSPSSTDPGSGFQLLYQTAPKENQIC